MELRTFISKALQEIFAGVKDAQMETLTGAVAPLIVPHDGNTISSVQLVTFNVCVEITDDTSKDSKIGVAKWLDAGMSEHSGKSKSNTSTLTFSIPIQLPAC